MGGVARRVFLGWDSPLLDRAVDWLLEEVGDDLEGVILATPGRRAGRMLSVRLARRADPSRLPAQVMTAGQLTDELLLHPLPKAERLCRTMAWAQSLEALGGQSLGAISSRAPKKGDQEGFLRLAETVRGLHGELAADGLSFENLLSEKSFDWSAGEERRWQALRKAQQGYRDILSGLGLSDPHEARLSAVTRGEIKTDRPVFLVGVPEANRLLCRFLGVLGDQVTALVAAPESEADGFDDLGCVSTEYWSKRDVDLSLEQWRVVDKPADQSAVFEATLGEWNGRFAAEEISIGVCDEEVAPFLKRRLGDLGITARHAAGTPLEQTGSLRLLGAAGRLLRNQRFRSMAEFVRHPDLERTALDALGPDFPDPVALLDRTQQKHLLDALPGANGTDWPGAEAGECARLEKAMNEALGSLGDGRLRNLSAWAEPLRGFLTRVHQHPAEADQSGIRERVLRSLGGALSALENIPPGLAAGKIGAPAAIDLLLRQVSGEVLPPDAPVPGQPTIELLGWLELLHDDAPALFLTGFNEGRLPATRAGDGFLPDGTRKRLSLPCNEDRLARDAYALTAISNARDALVCVTGRRNHSGDPLVPSRLAFHRPEAEAIARMRRVMQAHPVRMKPEGDPALIERPLPRAPQAPTPERMRVTSFRLFLQSPYQFYLQHVLNLETLDDRARELDPLKFGILAHRALEVLGRGDLASCTDARVLGDALDERLVQRAREVYGKEPLPAIALQVEQLRFRLAGIANWQADRAAEGWAVHAVEWRPEGGSRSLDVDGTPMRITGQIDRIDYHAETQRYAIIDYKTGETVADPTRHRRARSGEWVDLQLPLYRFLAEELLQGAEPLLGYASIPKEPRDIGVKWAGWNADDLDGAMETAREVIRKVRKGEYFERGAARPHAEITSAILGLGLFGPAEEDEEQEQEQA